MADISAETAQRILHLPMEPNDADAATIHEYLIALLRTVWLEGSDFSGKRPFGNSGWESELYAPLIRAGLLDGTLDEDGYPDDYDQRQGDQLILAAIGQLT